MSLLLAAWLSTAQAHDIRPGALALHEREPGRFSVRMTPPQDGGVAVQLRPVWPKGCAMAGTTLQCAEGLSGTLHLPGVGKRSVRVLLRVTWLDGTVQQQILEPGEDPITLGRRGPGTDGRTVGSLHALRRWDIVLFVAGLAALCHSVASQVGAVGAFALGHALTLGMTAGILVVRPGAVELVFALSLLLIGREVLADTSTSLTRRFPWCVALLTGLLHGLGSHGRSGGDAVAAGLSLGAGSLVLLAGCATVSIAWRRAPERIRPHGRRLVAATVGLAGGVWATQRAVAWLTGP